MFGDKISMEHIFGKQVQAVVKKNHCFTIEIPGAGIGGRPGILVGVAKTIPPPVTISMYTLIDTRGVAVNTQGTLGELQETVGVSNRPAFPIVLTGALKICDTSALHIEDVYINRHP